MIDSKKTSQSIPAAASSTRALSTRWTLNRRTVLVSAVVLAVVLPSAYFWHHYQTQKNSAAFLARAETLEQDAKALAEKSQAAADRDPLNEEAAVAIAESREKYRQAARMLHRYLQTHPADVQTRIRLAKNVELYATSPQEKPLVLEKYQAALRIAPDQVELRSRIAELHLEMQELVSAEEEADRVLQAAPRDSRALAVRARVLDTQARGAGRVSGEQVERAYLAAIAEAPADVDLTSRLALFYQQTMPQLAPEERTRRAETAFKQLLVHASKDYQAWLARYQYKQQFKLPDADADLVAAAKVAPHEFAVLLAQATRATDTGDAAQQEKYFREITERYPRDSRGYLGLAQALVETDTRQAIEVLERGLKANQSQDLGLSSALANLYLQQGQTEKAQTLLAVVRQKSDAVNIQLNTQQRMQLGGSVGLLESSLLMAREEYAAAIEVLGKIVTSQPVGDTRDVSVQQHAQAWTQLAVCQSALRHWDQAAVAFENAAKLNDNPTKLLLAAGQAHESAGNLRAAMRCVEVAAITDAPAEVHATLVRMKLQEQLALPAEQRNWKSFEQVLAKALERAPGDPQIRLSEAHFLAAQGGSSAALSQLLSLANETPRDRPLQRRIVLLLATLGENAAADQLVARWKELPAGLEFEDVLVAAELRCQQGEFAEALEVVRGWQPANLSEKGQRDLLFVTAQMHWRMADIEPARAALTELLKQTPQDLDALQMSAELAIEADDIAAVKQIEARLEELEGPSGTLWRGIRAQRLLGPAGPNATALSAAQAKEVQSLLTAIATARPQWPNGHALQGQLAQQQGQESDAIDHYVRAMELGERRIHVYRELIALLQSNNRETDANQYLMRLSKLTAAPSDRSIAAIPGLLRGGELERAVTVAREQLEKDPGNAVAHLWLAQTLAASQDLPEAESTLRTALKQFPDDTRVWLSSISFFKQAGRANESDELMAQLAEHPSLQPSHRALALAQGYELLADLPAAKKHYLEAQRLAPDNIGVFERSGTFFARVNETDEAIRSWRRAVEIAPRAESARRALVTILASRTTEADWKEAWQLMEGMESSNGEDVVNKRLKALLLKHRGSPENLVQARTLMEEIVNGPGPVAANDRVFLAHLCERDNPQLAREQLELAVSGESPAAPHVAALVDLLLKQGNSAEAQQWLKQLETLLPDALVTLRLRAEYLASNGQKEEIKEQVDRFMKPRMAAATTPVAQARLQLEMSQLLNQHGLSKPAEAAFREVLKLQPRNYQPLAGFLVDQNRTSDAVALCVASASQPPAAEDITAICLILCRGKPTAEDARAAEPMLKQAEADKTTSANLLCAIATWRYINGEQPAALRVFRRVLDQEPNHLSALNNLANMLSEQPETCAEARQYIERAIEIRGPHANLLDTLGVIQLRQGEIDRAVLTLKEAAESAAPDPRYFLHLALAYAQQGNKAAAQKALKLAQEARLDELVLSSVEKTELSELRKELTKG